MPAPWFGHEVRSRGSVVIVRRKLVHAAVYPRPASRGDVLTWSPASRRRFCRAVASVPWSSSRERVFVTLTFRELRHDGRRELLAFRKRWERRFGLLPVVWWREFQRSGRCHYHLLAEVPRGSGAELVRSRWAHRCWSEVGGGFVDVRRWAGNGAALVRYARKEVLNGSKSYQHALPAALDGEASAELVDPDTGEVERVAAGLGRWWGVWHCRGGWELEVLTHSEYLEARRRFRRWLRAQGRGVWLKAVQGRHWWSWWAVAPPELVADLGRFRREPARLPRCGLAVPGRGVLP